MIRYIAIALSLSLGANAQTPFVSEVELFGGPSLSNYWGNDRPDHQVTNPTYFFGAGVAHSFKDKFEVNVKVLYERKGNKMDYVSTLYDENDIATDYGFIQGNKLEYLTLLPTLKYYIDKKDKFYVGLGCYLSYLRKAATYTEMRSLDTGALSYYYYQNDDNYDAFDFGLSAATGYRVQLRAKLFLNFQLTSNLGLVDIVSNDIQMDGSTKCFNLLLGVGLSYKP